MDWYPWYPAIYRADTMHLSAEQDGIYRRLLDHYMETRQPLPDNDAALARISGVGIDTWVAAAPLIRPFFTPSKGGYLHHKRCNTELERQDGRNRKQSEKGKLGAKKRWNKESTNQSVNSSGHTSAMAQPMPSDARGQEIRREENNISTVSTDSRAELLTPFQIIFDEGVKWFPHLMIKTTSPIHQWIEAGCDIEKDILATIRRCRGNTVNSWGYFTPAISEAMAVRTNPMPKGSPNASIRNESTKSDRTKASAITGYEQFQSIIKK